MKAIFSILFLISGSYFCELQAQLRIEYGEFEVGFRPVNCSDTFKMTLTKKYAGDILVIFLRDCRGKAFFELYSKKRTLKMTGSFESAEDTLTKYSLSKTLGLPSDKRHTLVTVIKYMYPLPSGIWTLYDEKGRKTKEFEYSFSKEE